MASSAVSKLIEEHREFVGRGTRNEHSWLAMTIIRHGKLQENLDTIRSVKHKTRFVQTEKSLPTRQHR